MTEIAVGILSKAQEAPSSGNHALREWAAEVLANPGNPPNLSDEARKSMINDGLPFYFFEKLAWQIGKEGEIFRKWEDASKRLGTIDALLGEIDPAVPAADAESSPPTPKE